MNENKNRATLSIPIGIYTSVSAGCAIIQQRVEISHTFAGQNGGGAFLFLYLICLVLLGLPIPYANLPGRGSN